LAEEDMATSVETRERLANELRLDLIGPSYRDDAALRNEILPDPPSRWYLTGFLVPLGAAPRQKTPDPQEEMDAVEEGGVDDDETPERGPSRPRFLPSSMGLSLLVEPGAQALRVTARWGDYRRDDPAEEDGGEGGAGKDPPQWHRTQREAAVEVPMKGRTPIPLVGSDGLEIAGQVRETQIRDETGDRKVLAVSLFLVNRRPPHPEPEHDDEAVAFQAELEVASPTPIVARFDISGRDGEDIDARIADLHYRDVADWAVGHNVSVAAEVDGGVCRRVRTRWVPAAFVPRFIPGAIDGVELGMEALGGLADGAMARAALGQLPARYRDWIERQRGGLGSLSARRREVADMLLGEAHRAASRIEDGIGLLDDARVLDAFRMMNRAMGEAARRRRPNEAPRWYPFQVAFILLNLRGLVTPAHGDREIVDLLFFPTGGGKTEAYLGLSAFVLIWRRLSHPGFGGCGLAVLMRYTLRLLTLDQLGRAAAVVCALELARRGDPGKLGDWPFEIGLWVGRGATPNRMGEEGDRNENSARARVLKYKRDTTSFPPIPIDSCPWCGEKLKPDAFRLVPDTRRPTNLLLVCSNRRCAFSTAPGLPVLTVDEPIYRRLPGFLIATCDKFAMMPWVGEVGAFFGRVDRADADGFYSPAEPGRGSPLPGPMPPPDLIIQDELHLISGPLGSMAGLYETALETLCKAVVEGKTIRPKLIASTATVRRAQTQIQALFDRSQTAIFPPPGPNRADSFFAQSDEAAERARLYLGLAAPGRSPKVLFLRAATTLAAAALKAWEETGGAKAYAPMQINPADPYMTIVAYFNALRELGSARRIVDDEVRLRASRYGSRQRIGEKPRFADRTLHDALELTSRIGTAEVADTKARLGNTFDRKDPVDVALATNMISVGLDIIRLGLMLVSGQPKTVGEYIQATSRVGRDPDRPGLVVALLNVYKPRDRSHYERFAYWHAGFYRAVEATSVTPFAPRALDRGLAAIAVAMARLGHDGFAPNRAAGIAEVRRADLDDIAAAVAARAASHREGATLALAAAVRARTASLLDDWASLAHERNADGTAFGYARDRGITKTLLREVLDPELALADARERRFRAPRSLRDVEPSVLLRKVAPNGAAIDEEAP
jgi:hypothetical protein